MALTAEVTKVWPTLAPNGTFNVGVEVVLKEDAVEARRATFTEATIKTADVSGLAGALVAKIQPWIDAYKSEKTAYNHAKMTALVNSVQSGISV